MKSIGQSAGLHFYQFKCELVQMEKQFGKGAILRLGSKAVVPVNVISSGLIRSITPWAWEAFRAGTWRQLSGP